ncbi:carbohydrate kinase [Micromonospora sp. 4G57]|uniref:Carbohydrate kinase n=1 Tax=Micromonospora sicca TaxID=2202420 RepID=A0ABU5JHC6_9ACTN|nr:MULTISPECIES: carbohydrate kinase [unclassified Micromonospora]MDZ5447501.1 carbohydrate kinase [Micromonospora sp. 4G57]MDZ5492028.1 carbohydrate kinase [Micromonospora sp. 4G53]
MLTVLGEAVIDLAPSGGGDLLAAHPGGSPLNVAVGLARLGRPTAMLARFSRTSFGRRLRAHAEANGVDLTWAVADDRPATLAVVALDVTGAASYDFYLDGTADWHWAPHELDGVPAGTRVLHTGSLATLLPPGADLLADLLAREHAAGRVLVSLDPNVRPAVLADPDAARARLLTLARHAHLVKASDEDLAWLFPGASVEEAADRLLDLGVRLVVATRGAAGSYAATTDVSVARPARRVAVADTVGAGDAFTAGLLDALVEADAAAPAAVGALDWARLGAVLDHATLVAGMTCERPGADPPRRDELANVVDA